jgi:hypothetical protein
VTALSPLSLSIEGVDEPTERRYSISRSLDLPNAFAPLPSRYGDRVTTYHNFSLRLGWPPHDFWEKKTTHDLVDFSLLDYSEFVIGSVASSFSRFAMRYIAAAKVTFRTLRSISFLRLHYHTNRDWKASKGRLSPQKSSVQLPKLSPL